MHSNLFAIPALFVIAQAASPILLSVYPPANASIPPLESFVSFSIEFASFPDFAGRREMTVYERVLTAAGNSTNPNIFSYNLLKNLGDLQGSYPIIRVGGNTQYEQAKSDM